MKKFCHSYSFFGQCLKIFTNEKRNVAIFVSLALITRGQKKTLKNKLLKKAKQIKKTNKTKTKNKNKKKVLWLRLLEVERTD